MLRVAFIASLVLLAYLYRLVYAPPLRQEYRDVVMDSGQLYSIYATLLLTLALLPLLRA